MGLEFCSDRILYENRLDTKKFEKLLDNKSQCYKCYWLEAIMRLFPENEEITFEQIIDEMIWEAWSTVSHYHLHLGPTINGNAENFNQFGRNNLNAQWALDSLYIPGNTPEQFKNMLAHNLKPVDDAAKLQGYDTWGYGLLYH